MVFENALVWLIDNHPAHANVALDIRQIDALGAPGDNTRRSGEEIRGRNYRDVGAPQVQSSDDDVDDPFDAAGRGTRGARPPRESFIPDDDISGQTERASVRHALERLAAGSEGREGNDVNDAGPPRVDHPRQLDPLPEHRTRYLASKCFPWLFPYGRADPFYNARPRDVSFADHIRHLMRYADDHNDGTFHYRFASDRLFRYWCLDMKMRQQVRQQCRVYLQQNPTTAGMTVEDVIESTRENVRSIIGQMTRYSANVSGSDGYWLSQQEKLESAVEQLPSLTVFTTYSAADHH